MASTGRATLKQKKIILRDAHSHLNGFLIFRLISHTACFRCRKDTEVSNSKLALFAISSIGLKQKLMPLGTLVKLLPSLAVAT